MITVTVACGKTFSSFQVCKYVWNNAQRDGIDLTSSLKLESCQMTFAVFVWLKILLESSLNKIKKKAKS
jgi:hypothetical protein